MDYAHQAKTLIERLQMLGPPEDGKSILNTDYRTFKEQNTL